MPKILIIEDEAAIRRVLVKILAEENETYHLDEAEDGSEGGSSILSQLAFDSTEDIELSGVVDETGQMAEMPAELGELFVVFPDRNNNSTATTLATDFIRSSRTCEFCVATVSPN